MRWLIEAKTEKTKQLRKRWFVFYYFFARITEIYSIRRWTKYGVETRIFDLLFVAKNGNKYKSCLKVLSSSKNCHWIDVYFCKNVYFCLFVLFLCVIEISKVQFILLWIWKSSRYFCATQSPWMEFYSAFKQKFFFFCLLYFCFYSQFLSVLFMFSGHKMWPSTPWHTE